MTDLPILNVLLVEDDEDDYVIIRDTLDEFENTKITLDWVNSFNAAREAMARRIHHLCLLDFRLGEHNGLELIDVARTNGFRAPIIMLTGQEERQIDLAAMQRGATDYLVKGKFDASSLERSMRYAIEHCRVVEAFRASESRFRLLAENATDMISRLATDGVFLYVSPSSQSLLGLGASELTRTSLFDHCHPDDVERLQMPFKQLAGTGIPLTIEHRIRGHDGYYGWFETTFKMVRHADKRTEIQASSRDITKRRQLESELRQAQKMDAIGVLSEGIAHEINTPMQFIRDNNVFIRDQILPLLQLPGLDEFVQSASQPSSTATSGTPDVPYLREQLPMALQDTLDGINQIITLTAALSEVANSSPTTVADRLTDINLDIKRALLLARSEVDKVADVHLELSPNLPKIRCLSKDLTQVFIHILVNAAHAIQERLKCNGERRGRIDIITDWTNGDILITFRDDGCGMSDDVQSRIFEPFFTTRDVGQGTGIGLMVAHEIIIHKYAGRIDINSKTGTGTEFNLVLPAVK